MLTSGSNEATVWALVGYALVAYTGAASNGFETPRTWESG